MVSSGCVLGDQTWPTQLSSVDTKSLLLKKSKSCSNFKIFISLSSTMKESYLYIYLFQIFAISINLSEPTDLCRTVIVSLLHCQCAFFQPNLGSFQLLSHISCRISSDSIKYQSTTVLSRMPLSYWTRLLTLYSAIKII